MKNKWKIYTTSKLIDELCKEFDELVFVDTEKVVYGRGKNKGKDRVIYPLMSLVYLVKKIYMGYYKHNTFDTYSSIHYKTIDTWFGKDNRTTINIFNPSGQTSTTSLSDEVTVDGGTGESSSTASQGGASGGFFGGGKDGKEKMNNPKNLAKRKKTYLPLLFIVAGISIFIFKPFK